MKDCELCPLLINQTRSDENVILQTKRWVVVLDKNQEYLGKSFVTLREHKETISDLSVEDWEDLHHVMTKFEHAVRKAYNPDVFNWSCLMNNAIVAGQKTHVHWHVHPRFRSARNVLDVTFEDPKWPLRREKTFNVVGQPVYNQITQTIKENL